LADVFALQDRLTRQIASALEVTLTPNEEIGLSQYSKVDPQAYDLYLQGRARVAVYSPQANAEARDFFESAIARDPSFGRAHAGLALTHAVDATFGWSADAELSREKAARHARTALAIDSISPQMHYVLAQIYGSQRRIEDGIEELRQAVALDPNYADGHVVLGLFLAYAGKPEEAIVSIRKGMKLSPRHGYIYPYTLSNAYFVMGRYDEAASIIENVLERNNNFQQGRLLLISIYGLLNRKEDAEWEIAELLTALPDFSIADEEARVRFTHPEVRERYIEGLQKAGLPQ
jgi:adenylate cyclase